MNMYQRAVLVLGGIVLAVAYWTTPRYMYVQGIVVQVKAGSKIGTVDMGDVFLRTVTIVGITGLLFFTLKNIGKKS